MSEPVNKDGAPVSAPPVDTTAGSPTTAAATPVQPNAGAVPADTEPLAPPTAAVSATVPPPEDDPPVPLTEPAFVSKLRELYRNRGKRVIVLIGNVRDIFPNKTGTAYVSLDQLLLQVFGEAFNMVRIDHAEGFQCQTRQDRDSLKKVWQRGDQQLELTTIKGEERLGDFDTELKACDSPLSALMMLREVCRATNLARAVEASAKPVCSVFQYAGTMFPAGDIDKLDEVNKARLVHFMKLIDSAQFQTSHNLLILVADNASELNAKITGSMSVATLEIDTPTSTERRAFVQRFKPSKPEAKPPVFEGGRAQFREDTQGFTLTAVRDMLESACLSGTPITRSVLVAEMNRLLKAELGDIISIKIPDHGPEDIIGFEDVQEVLRLIFRMSDDPATATSSLLVTGPSGEGKTFLLEAFASISGRLIIELKGLRSMWFGQTDVLLEKLSRVIRRYRRLLILVDEADTQFGRVDNNDTQDTEKRLVGGILRLVGDPSLAGVALWAFITARPECLAPDMKSRSSDQVPVFPLSGPKREQYIKELLTRKKFEFTDEEFVRIVDLTKNYSNRDLTALVKKARGLKMTIIQTLEFWGASGAIVHERRLQMLRAALHCSYPKLLPEDLRKKLDDGELAREIELLRVLIA